MLKYFYIGGADICFWWSVWLLSDLWSPMDITKDGSYSFLRGYVLILTANFLYLAIRVAGRDTFNRYWEDHSRSVYPSAILTRTKVVKKKSWRFYILKSTFSICIYILVVGFIQIWRGLFASFDYLISNLHSKFSVVPVLSCVLAQIIVALTLAFTQKNNAVNLCPTHKMYKYDELCFTDHLFFINLFGNFRRVRERTAGSGLISLAMTKMCEDVCETIENQHALATLNTPVATLHTPRFSDEDFDVVEFATSRLISTLQRNRLKGLRRSTSDLSLSKYNSGSNQDINTVKKWQKSYRLVIEQERVRKNNDDDNKKNVRKTSTSILMEANGEVKWQYTNNDSTFLSPDRSQTGKRWRSSIQLCNPHFEDVIGNSDQTKLGQQQEEQMTRQHRKSIIIHVQTFEKQNNQAQEQQDISSSRSPKVQQPNNHTEANQFNRKKNLKSMVKEHTPLHTNDIVSMREKYLIRFLGYLYAIHHRQVFLHIFGGLFWSTTWKLFDLATASLFTQTATDLPGLALIAVFCHCMNHLVLFRFKEVASKIHWKAFWEFFCGLLTVCLWASVWYMWDILLNIIGKNT